MMKDYTIPGPQTPFTERVYEHAGKASRLILSGSRGEHLSEPRLSITKTSEYIDRHLDETTEPKMKVFRKRDLDQILKEGVSPKCSDIGVVFRGLMAAQGVPTAYVETLHEDFVLDKQPRTANVMSHALAKVYRDDGSPILVDPGNLREYRDEVDLFQKKGYVVFREGLDSWDLGIYGLDDLKRVRDSHREELLVRRERNLMGRI